MINQCQPSLQQYKSTAFTKALALIKLCANSDTKALALIKLCANTGVGPHSGLGPGLH
jgi:hypothetical protein